MTPAEPERHRISIHEAGHATAALLLGRRWGCAVFDAGDAGGAAGPGDLKESPDLSRYTPPALHGISAGRSLDDLLDDCVVYASGRVAELLDADTVHATAAAVVKGPDSAMIEEAAAVLLGRYPSFAGCQAVRAVAFHSAWHLLANHVPAIRAVSVALHTRRRLSAAEVAEVFAGAEK